MKSPLVSVVIPVFNMEQQVSGAVESVLNQSYKHIEIIVIDDGSTDGTRNSIEMYIDSERIRFCYQENSGVSSARNKGVELSTGEYIAFLDADDTWLEDKLEEQLNVLMNNRHINAITCGHIEEYADGRRNRYKKVTKSFPNRSKLLNALSVSQILPGSSSGMLVHESCLKEVGGFDSSLTVGEDWDMWLRIAQIDYIDVVEKPLVIIKRGESDKPSDRTFEKEISDVERVIAKSVPAHFRRRALAALYARIGSSCISSDRISDALGYLSRSLGLWPLPIYPLDIRDVYKFPKIPRYYLLLKGLLLAAGVLRRRTR